MKVQPKSNAVRVHIQGCLRAVTLAVGHCGRNTSWIYESQKKIEYLILSGHKINFSKFWIYNFWQKILFFFKILKSDLQTASCGGVSSFEFLMNITLFQLTILVKDERVKCSAGPQLHFGLLIANIGVRLTKVTRNTDYYLKVIFKRFQIISDPYYALLCLH